MLTVIEELSGQSENSVSLDYGRLCLEHNVLISLKD